MRSSLRLIACSLVVFLATFAGVRAAGPDLAARPPMDPAVLSGTLANGMRYYVRRCEKPEKHVELRLAVRIGSVQETEDERGLAHFNEHMNFNGTTHFKSGELVSYLESIGARFGADSNAYTNYDETVYMLTVPTDKEGALEKAMTIMADWAGGATLSPEEIEKERGVVGDELRGNKGARKRIRDKQDQIFLRGSRYADRQTIGLEKVIMGSKPETVQGFYHKWYHPDVMAIIAVGDFDAADMEQRIKSQFGALPAGDKHVDVPLWPVPPHDETLYSVESDKELTRSSVQVQWKHENEPTHVVGDIRRDLVRQIATALLSVRLNERAQKADPPYINASAGTYEYVTTLGVFGLFATAKDGEIPKATTALMEELDRARQHGFVSDELERVKTLVLTVAENQLKESAQRRSGERVDGIVSSFLEDTPLTSDEWDVETMRGLLPGISIDEVNASLRAMSEPTNRVVLVQVPEKEGVATPTVDQMKAIVEPATARQVEAYVDDLAGKKLVTDEPAGGKVVTTSSIPELGFEKVVLSNGVTVLWKKTDLRNDQILMSAFAQGGAADYGKDRYIPALRADTYALESGLADFTAPQLQKWMTGSGKLAGVSPNVNRFARSMSGSCRPADFDLMMQLSYLYFTKPAFRDDAFKRMVDDEVQSLKNQLNSPGGMYGRAVNEVATSNHWLFRAPTVGEIRALKAAEVEADYREMFDDGSEWTFILVGNFNQDQHLPLIEKWLGSLPSKSATPTTSSPDVRYKDLALHFPQGRNVREVRKGIEDQSRTLIMIDAPYRLDPQAAFDIDAATDLLDIRLRDKLREERGETYGASAGFSGMSPYKDYGRINISFTGSPDNREGMVKDVKDAIRWMKMTVPKPEDVGKLKEMRYNELAVSEKENGYWLGGVYSALVEGRDPRTMLDYRRRIDKLDAHQVFAAAKRWFDMDDVSEVYLVPETWTKGKKPAETPKPEAAAAPAPTPAAAAAPAPVGGM